MATKTKWTDHKLGDKHFIEGTACSVRFLNAGTAWLSPVTDDPTEATSARHIAFAKIDGKGKVTLL